MDHDLNGRVAIVVGGGQTPGALIGNGRATSVTLARHGAEVVVAARHLDRAQTTVDMIEEEGGKGWAYEIDAAKKEDCQKLIDEEFNKCMDVNLLGAMYCNMFAADAMQKKNIRGAIVNVSSIASVQNRTGQGLAVDGGATMVR